MNVRKVGLYVVLALALLLVAQLVVEAVLAIVGFVWAAVTTAVTLLVLLGLAYGLYRGVRWLRDGDSDSVSSTPRSADTRSVDSHDTDSPVDQLTDRYVEGDLSEAELERRLDRTLDGPDRDESDRELERSE